MLLCKDLEAPDTGILRRPHTGTSSGKGALACEKSSIALLVSAERPGPLRLLPVQEPGAEHDERRLGAGKARNDSWSPSEFVKDRDL